MYKPGQLRCPGFLKPSITYILLNMIAFIVATDKNFLIGKNNTLPWEHIRADMKHFRSTTTGKTVVMGRKTFESIGSKPLKNRENIVLTRDISFKADGVVVLHEKDEVLEHCKNKEEVCILGGAEIFKLFLPDVQKIYLTTVHSVFEGDIHFPFTDFSQWKKIDETEVKQDEDSPYDLTFATFVRP